MSEDYQIISWDGIISTNRLPLASITFKPNKAFIEQFLQNSNNRLQIRISGTQTKYDGVWIALIDTSANVPNCRKNFYDATQYWIATLIGSTWQGQPTALGQMSIVNGPYKVYQNYFNNLNSNENKNSQHTPSNCKPIDVKCPTLSKSYYTEDSCNKYIWFLVAFLALILVLFLIYRSRK